MGYRDPSFLPSYWMGDLSRWSVCHKHLKMVYNVADHHQEWDLGCDTTPGRHSRAVEEEYRYHTQLPHIF